MKASVLKSSERVESRNDRAYGIQTFGENNDYPQRCREISAASGTGASCLRTYAKFIAGRGFTDEAFGKAKANHKGQSNNYLAEQIARDRARHGGFALHINYNALFHPVELQYIPFETIRFEAMDDDGKFSKVAVHPDWGRRFQAVRRFKKEDIDWIDLFNPDPAVIQSQVDAAGGWANYKGQVYYYSDAGDKVYSTPIYDCVLTDMSTEEGVGNVKLRNARNNMLGAGMFVDIRNDSESKDQQNQMEETLMRFTSDERACSTLYAQVGSEEEIPRFISMRGENYDKEFTCTETSVQANIGKAFNQPPILRAEDVGGNFGADAMKNGYNAYNSITEPERITTERVFSEIYALRPGANLSENYSTAPLEYTFNDSSLKEIPAEIFAVMTVNEKRALLGLPEMQDNESDQQMLAEKIGVGGGTGHDDDRRKRETQ